MSELPGGRGGSTEVGFLQKFFWTILTPWRFDEKGQGQILGHPREGEYIVRV